MEGRTWVLVADCSRGRIFEEGRKGLNEIMGFCHMEGREHVKDFVRDRSGRRAGNGSGVSATPSPEPKDLEARKFAHHLNDVLRRAFCDNIFHQLVLVAPPHFLGILRQVLDKQVAQLVVATIDKDLTYVQSRELAERVFLAKAK